MTELLRWVMFDNSVTNRLAEAGIDPISALAGSEFVIAYTPDLKREYTDALNKESVGDAVKALIIKI